MSLEFIYKKGVTLDDENNFTIFIFEKNSVEKQNVFSSERYLPSSLELNLKSEDITKWLNYETIKTLSDLINATKKKNITH